MLYALRVGNLTDDSKIRFHNNGFGYWGFRIRGDGTFEEPDGSNFDFYKFHGFMMWAAWGIFGLVQLASNRYLKVYWRLSMWIHRISGLIILLITLTLSFLALSKAGWEVEIGVHQIMGVIILSLVLLIVLGGVFNRSMMQRFRWRTADMLKIKRGHRVSDNLDDVIIIIVLWIFNDINNRGSNSDWKSQVR